jgi:hypothetical protein
MIDRMPQPALVALLADKTPHFIHLADLQRSGRIAYPTGIETHINDEVLHLGHAPSVAVVEQKTPFGTEDVLAQVALCSPGRFAAFDNLIALTVRASDRDKCHGSLLALGHHQYKAQCDINLSRSPLLKHYPQNHRPLLSTVRYYNA